LAGGGCGCHFSGRVLDERRKGGGRGLEWRRGGGIAPVIKECCMKMRTRGQWTMSNSRSVGSFFNKSGKHEFVDRLSRASASARI
jgi:hypothetical protein